jgi:predicted ferric reductase
MAQAAKRPKNILKNYWPLLLSIFLISILVLPFNETISRIDLTHTSEWFVLASKIFITTGTIFLCLNYILAARIKLLEKWFKGLDKMYGLHNWLGRWGMTLAILHPIMHLIAKTIRDSEANGIGLSKVLANIRFFFLPGGFEFINYGILALYLFGLLVVLTIFIKLPYEIWKPIHSLMGIPLIIAALHILKVNPGGGEGIVLNPYYIWLYAWLILGVIAYIYKFFLYDLLAPGATYVIDKVTKLDTIVEFWLKPENPNKHVEFLPGQYAFIKVISNPGILREPHAYTISEIGEEGRVRISSKMLGNFSASLFMLKIGDKVQFKGPHGMFPDAQHSSDRQIQIWVAGGIGITPFLALLQAEANSKTNSGKRVHFFYGTPEPKEAVYDEEVSRLTSGIKNVTMHKHYSDADGFMTVDYMLDEARIDKSQFDEVKILMCGPPVMMDIFLKQFKEKGFTDDQVFFEEFSIK